VVVLVSIDEHHDIGRLLDATALAEVREERPLVLPCFDASI
jgi:hypothetical protein